MEQAVKEKLDLKQAQNAVKALQKYFKDKQDKFDGPKKKLLDDDEHAFIQLSFTLTKVPT